MRSISRRKFLAEASALGIACSSILGGCSLNKKEYSGSIKGARADLGHKLRNGALPEPSETKTTKITIVGGGMAALSAAWWLKRNNISDFLILELDSEVGGSSRSGENSITPYPWGAHYVPVPNIECEYVRELFDELGVITGYSASGTPKFNEYYLCHAPEERLYLYGRWQNGLLPEIGISGDDKSQYKIFFDEIEKFRIKKGNDGRYAFAIPLRLSSRDPEILSLDTISFSRYLESLGINSKPLLWYIDYCCRDDYGARPDAISAWAGIHYFAGRRPHGDNLGESDLLTWPAGNGWLVEQLSIKVKEQIIRNALVFRVIPENLGVETHYFDAQKEISVKVKSDFVIYCAPRFTAPFVVKNISGASEIKDHCQYSPWMVANLTLNHLPDRTDTKPAWDSVIYDTQSLGYVLATHQSLGKSPDPLVITYYKALCYGSPATERNSGLHRSFNSWCKEIVSELTHPHPGIEDSIQNIDLWLWGHGMIRPSTNYIWSFAEKKLPSEIGRIYFAHSDMSGISIFEEAQYQGVEQAKKIAKIIGS